MLTSIALALLAQTAVTPEKAAPRPTAQGTPIWAAAWGNPGGDYPHITPMVVLDGDFRPDQDNTSVDAENLAKQLSARPPGRRVLLVQRYCHSFWGARSDLCRDAEGGSFPAPWCDDALRQLNRDWPRILSLTKYCGATIDFLVADFEESGAFSAWSAKPAMIDAIRSDPRWERPGPGLPPLAELLSALSSASGEEIGDSSKPFLLQWNKQIERYATRYMAAGIWTAAHQVYPKLRGSNYEGYLTDATVPPCKNGHLQQHDNVFGTHSAPALYGEVEGLATRYVDPLDPTRIRNTPARPGDTRLTRTPWVALLSNQQTARSCIRAGSPLMPWIANPSYDGSPPGKGLACYTTDIRCWDENIRHVALLGVETLLWWRRDSRSTPEETGRLDRLLQEINAETGGKVLRPLETGPVAFNAEWVVSGAARADGKFVWRITVSPTCLGVTVKADGKQIRPGAATLGEWIVTETAQPPVIEPLPRS